MVDQLFVSDPDGSSQNFTLTGETITIGRTAVNDIVLPLDTISSRHARLNRTPGGWQITDLGSTNGTFLDGKKLAPNVPQMWEPGVELRLEPLILTWEAAESRMPTPLPVAEEVLDPPTQTLETTGSGGVSNLNSIKIEPMSVTSAGALRRPILMSASASVTSSQRGVLGEPALR
jgi:predicted component of type VI protein secretion system